MMQEGIDQQESAARDALRTTTSAAQGSGSLARATEQLDRQLAGTPDGPAVETLQERTVGLHMFADEIGQTIAQTLAILSGIIGDQNPDPAPTMEDSAKDTALPGATEQLERLRLRLIDLRNGAYEVRDRVAVVRQMAGTL